MDLEMNKVITEKDVKVFRRWQSKNKGMTGQSWEMEGGKVGILCPQL